MILGILVLAAVGLWAVAELTSETEVVTQTVAADGVDRIVVNGEAGNITVTVEDRSDIEVTSELRSSLWSEVDYQVDMSDDTLTVVSECENAFVSNCSASHTIRVPADAVDELDLTTTAGSIAVTGSSAEVDARTTAGDIELLDHSGEDAALRTTAGGITVDANVAPRSLSAETTAGSIVITVPDEVYAVDTDTTAGGVEVGVRTDPNADRTITASTTAGEITISTG
jgi:DUF4097 and DUF4098 domain-containing protein YvlB